MTHEALLITHDADITAQARDSLAALRHEHDVAETLLRTRKCLRSERYSYILLCIAFPTQSLSGPARVQNAEHALNELAETHGGDAPPVIMISAPRFTDSASREDVMRLSMAMGRRGAMDLIEYPFPTAGRTLDRVIKKILDGKGASARNGLATTRRSAPHATRDGQSENRKEQTSQSTRTILTKVERELLEALSESPNETMFQVEVADRAGYGKNATRQALRELAGKDLVQWPRGRRKGVTLTEKGEALVKPRAM
ncbi:MAG: hypothetical protein KGY81_06375 [Phycisphaerae bacterium]|nr:hypothetical protein [Phycisphaerae bacterium]